MKSMRLWLFLLLIAFFIPSVNAVDQVVASPTVFQESNISEHTISAVLENEWDWVASPYQLTSISNSTGTFNVSVKAKWDVSSAPTFRFKKNGVVVYTSPALTSAYKQYNYTDIIKNNTDVYTFEAYVYQLPGDLNYTASFKDMGLMYNYDGVLIGTGGQAWSGYTDDPSIPTVNNTILDISSDVITTGVWYDSFCDASIDAGYTQVNAWTEGTCYLRSPSTANSYIYYPAMAGTVNKEAIINYSLSQTSGNALSYLYRFVDTDNFYMYNDNANAGTNEIYIKNVGVSTLLNSSARISNTGYNLMDVIYSGFYYYGTINGSNNISVTNTTFTTSGVNGFRKGGSSGYFDINSWRITTIGQYWGNLTLHYNSESGNVVTKIQINGSLDRGYKVYYANNGTDNYTQIGNEYTTNQTIDFPIQYQDVSIRLWMNGTQPEASKLSSVYIFRQLNPSNPVNITSQWSSLHGINNSNLLTGALFDEINFNISTDEDQINQVIYWYQDGFLVSSGTSKLYNYSNSLYPGDINISAVVINGNYTSNTAYWLLNASSGYNYSGDLPVNLSSLQKPNKNQTLTILGNNTYFFNTTVGGSGWIQDNTNGSLECTGACTGIATYPIELWVRPIDGIININTKKSATMSSALKIYVNGTKYGSDIDMTDATGNYVITISGLNSANISYIKINSSTDDDFFLHNISYNRTFPSLYDGTNYFAIKKLTYMPNVGLEGYAARHAYFVWNESRFDSDMEDIKNNYSFNMIQLPLMIGAFVDEMRGNETGKSSNVYNQTALKYLDYMIDNASEAGLYVHLPNNQWGFHDLTDPRPKDQNNITTYPCNTCLTNETTRDSILELFRFLSNRYKNHTNVLFEIKFEMFYGNSSSPGYYNDPVNLAKFQAYSGMTSIPHNSSYSDAEYKKLFEWRLYEFYNLAHNVTAIVHENNQMISMSAARQISPTLYYEYSPRLLSDIPDVDYVGTDGYPLLIQTDREFSEYENDTYNSMSNAMSFGGIPYMVEYNVWNAFTGVTYPLVANNSNLTKYILEPTLRNKGNTGVLSKYNYEIAGYNWWAYQNEYDCSSQWYQACWGFKYANGTVTEYASYIAEANEILTITDYNPTSLILNTTYLYNQTFNITINKISDITWTINGDTVKTDSDVTYSYYNNSTAAGGENIVIATASDGINADSVTWAWNVDNIPPASVTNPQTATGNFFINNTWVNPVDSDFNHTWFRYANETTISQGNQSNTTTFLNVTYSPHYLQNISAQTCDTSGNCNSTKVWFNATIPNNAPVLASIGNINAVEGDTIDFTMATTDADSDTITNTSNNTKGTFTAATGNYNWVTSVGDAGTYIWNFSVSDGYGGTDIEVITVTITPATLYPNPVTNLQATTGNFWMNITWSGS